MIYTRFEGADIGASAGAAPVFIHQKVTLVTLSPYNAVAITEYIGNNFWYYVRMLTDVDK